MTTELILPAAGNENAERFKSNVAKFRQFVPAHINAAQLMAAIMHEVNTLPDGCTKGSVTICIVNTCILGLVPGPALGHLHFVPFKFNEGTEKEYTVAQLIVGYKGFLELAFANDFLADCNPELVLQGESVRRWHDINGPQILHELPEHRPEVTRENLVGAYCTYHTRAGGRGYYWRSKAEIDRIDRGQHSKTPWGNKTAGGYRSMCLKSAIRPTAKLWRLTKSMADAIMLDEQAERGETQAALTTFDSEYDPSADARQNLLAVLNHKVGCKSDGDREAVLSKVLNESVALSTLTPHQEKTALDKLMGWEHAYGQPLSKVLQLARE